MNHLAPRRWTTPGYTLLEMLMVVALLGLMSAVVIVNLPAQPQRLDAAAAEIAAAFRFARDESIRTEDAYGVDLDLSNQLLRVFRVDTSGTPVTVSYDVYHPLKKQLYSVDLTAQTPFSGVTLSAVNAWAGACTTPSQVGFNGDRIPRCGDPWGVTLTTSTITLSAGSFTKTVTLAGTTGRVTLSDTL